MPDKVCLVLNYLDPVNGVKQSCVMIEYINSPFQPFQLKVVKEKKTCFLVSQSQG